EIELADDFLETQADLGVLVLRPGQHLPRLQEEERPGQVLGAAFDDGRIFRAAARFQSPVRRRLPGALGEHLAALFLDMRMGGWQRLADAVDEEGGIAAE